MSQRAFGAIELIGVLAILVILLALLLPKISRTISNPEPIQSVNEAHIMQASIALQSLQAAVTAHLAQFGSLASLSGNPLTFATTYDQFGQVLLSEGLIERPFEVSLGTNAIVRLVRVSGLTPTILVDGANGAYDLHGDGRNDVLGASFVVEAVISGVSEAGARALNDQIDGPRLGSTIGRDDLLGRVIYRKAGLDGLTEVHIYILQK